jgi:hypothetical protein
VTEGRAGLHLELGTGQIKGPATLCLTSGLLCVVLDDGIPDLLPEGDGPGFPLDAGHLIDMVY